MKQAREPILDTGTRFSLYKYGPAGTGEYEHIIVRPTCWASWWYGFTVGAGLAAIGAVVGSMLVILIGG